MLQLCTSLSFVASTGLHDMRPIFLPVFHRLHIVGAWDKFENDLLWLPMHSLHYCFWHASTLTSRGLRMCVVLRCCVWMTSQICNNTIRLISPNSNFFICFVSRSYHISFGHTGQNECEIRLTFAKAEVGITEKIRTWCNRTPYGKRVYIDIYIYDFGCILLCLVDVNRGS